ncbi:ABC transporter ATP-binding protein [Sulfurospirillum diekertiae]|uniref:ABC transporter ATP-binding protein n=1 Tax=Sulfurospirillum diekertiae TaxID=1854492 RepID=UPI001E4636CD|nr:ABC transporter ATP-binding protein [Sulfurospirillum diekertiae]
MTIVTAEQLSKIFPNKDTPALHALDFSIETGKITGLVGPDGAGKTTLIRMLAGLLAPTSGKLEILGTLMPCTQSSLLQQIGYMPQKFGLYEDLSVDENLRLYATLQDVEAPKERIQELLEFTSLLEFRTRKAGALSGGMKQKLGLACALIKKPKLLLLDEPGVGVDPISRINLWEMIQTLLEEDVAVLWGTSYLDEADKCDSVILLNDGVSLYQGLPQKMKEPLKGEVYLVSTISTDKRRLLTHLLHAPDVMDAVLVGNTIRVNLKEGTSFPTSHLSEYDSKASFVVCAPTFEDAFVRLLGVKTEPESLLANQMAPKKEYQGYLIEAKKSNQNIWKVYSDRSY